MWEVKMDYPDLEYLCDRTWPLLFKYVYYRVNDVDDTNDIVQETYLRAIKNFENVRDKKSFLPYLKSIAKNIMIDKYGEKKISDIHFNEMNVEMFSDNVMLEEYVVNLEEKDRLYSCLLSLPEKYRIVIELRIIEGLSLKDCAKILGKSTSSIKNIQYRAIIKLRELMKKEALRNE
ncbi:RNA polymerase sigma factor [Thermoanaerobacterium thermosaccharolyticum]|uniref:RNA polymerase sigma factor n=2 Tax=Thermoanaerobacterium thermosaccharolyticum TaxID=1517 RepID=UPI003DA953AF